MKRYQTALLMLISISCHQEKIRNKLPPENPYYDRAWIFLDKKLPDSGFVYFNKAREISLKKGDSVKVAKCLINMAIISGARGDFFGSQELSLSVISYLNPGIADQKEILSSNYNNLGKMANRLQRYEEATQFYKKSIELANKEGSKNIYLNNLASNLTDQLKYGEALKYFRQLLLTKSIKENPITFSRILSNSSKAKWLKDSDYNPVPDFLNALYIRRAEEDLWGQNASFAHLADFYMDKMPDSALFYAHKMFRLAKQIKSVDDQVYALERLIKLSEPKQSKQYFEIYKKLDDSLETDRNAAKNQFAMIRYETEKNKMENLKLQKDNREKKYQISKQRIMLLSSFLLLIALAVIALLWYRKRKQKIELTAQTAIRDNQLKISKKIHDVVANGLYTVMSEIENKQELDKDRILDKMEILYEKSRNFTYEESPIAESDFRETVENLMAAFSADSRKVLLVGNEDELWSQIISDVKYEIVQILQELLVNMRKHSFASMVVIRFECIENQINIHYTDDGVGIKGTPKFKNGLTNTENRIQSIGGSITFDTENEKGLSILISFPITY